MIKKDGQDREKVDLKNTLSKLEIKEQIEIILIDKDS